jgi:hypothetical protein
MAGVVIDSVGNLFPIIPLAVFLCWRNPVICAIIILDGLIKTRSWIYTSGINKLNSAAAML